MHNSMRRFAKATDGNFAMITAILMIPIGVIVGLAMDYGRSTNERATMQNALDAASFAALSLPMTATKAQRQTALTNSYGANGGLGTATVIGDISVVDGIAKLKTTASAEVNTGFMRLAARNKVQLGVGSTVAKRQKLVEARFKLTEVTGWWDKKVSLYGKKEGASFKSLMEIDYVYNGLAGIGAGTTTVRKRNANAMTDVFKRTCLTAVLSLCVDSKLSGDGTATVDLADMEELYMQMDISASKPDAINLLNRMNPARPIRTNSPALSNRLFIDEKQQPQGKAVDIFGSIPCGQWSDQAWEDGGGTGGLSAWLGTDFKYEVQGKCDWTKDVAGSFLTE